MKSLTIDQQRADYISRIAVVDLEIEECVNENLREGLDSLMEERVFYCDCLASLNKVN